MSSERQRLRPWLEEMINSADIPGLCWIDNERTKFRVTWKHAGKPDFDLDRDAALFRRWAEHTGKYKPGEQPDPSTWKTRFRCALHKMPDVEEVKVPHSLDDREPYRVFRLKPRANSPRRSSQTSNSAPSPSPPSDYKGYPPFSIANNGFQNGFINPPPYGAIPYSPEMFPFSSPLSTTSSSSTDSLDCNNNLFPCGDDLADITPTLPTSVMSAGPFDDPMDEDDREPITCSLSNVFLMQSDTYSSCNGANMVYPLTSGFTGGCAQEPTFTELQSVRFNGERLGYTGNEAGWPQCIDAESKMFNMNPMTFENGFQAGLLRMLQGGMSMEGSELTPINQVGPMSSDDINNMNMSVPNSTPCTPIKAEVFSTPQKNCSANSLVEFSDLAKLMADAKGKKGLADCSMSVRVFYDEQEVHNFYLERQEHIWRMCYGSPIAADQTMDPALYSQIYGPWNAKPLELPQRKCSKETELVLKHFNRGLVLEMTEDGDIWVKRMCLSKVYYCNAFTKTQKLFREVKTKVFDFKTEFQRKLGESQSGICPPPSYDVTFMLGQPNGGLVCIVITHAQAKRILFAQQKGEKCVSEPNHNDKLASDLEKQCTVSLIGK